MKRFPLLLLVLILAACDHQKPLKLVSLLPFAERKPDTEVLLFTTGKFPDPYQVWSEPRKQAGGRFRWAKNERVKISWKGSLTQPAFLHLRVAAEEPLLLEAYSGGTLSSSHRVDGSQSVQVLPVPAGTSEVELKLPRPDALGVHSAVFTPSRSVAEFRKPAEFASAEKIYLKGKKRDAISFETGGSVSFYASIKPGAILETGYHFVAGDHAKDGALFSIYTQCEGGKRVKVFEQQVDSSIYKSVRVPIPGAMQKRSLCKLELNVAREVAFGKGKTAWIDPQLSTPQAPETESHVAERPSDFARNKNVVIIILDAASVRRFGCYGYNRGTTPSIDRLASEGVQFFRAYTNAVYTLASTATLFTGQVPTRHGILHHRNKLSGNAKTLAELLQNSGYRTAAFLANGNASGAFGLTQGFETAREVFREKDYVGWGQDITGAFSKWLKTQKGRKFFAYLHYREPHDPFNPPEEWVKKFVDPSYTGSIGTDHQSRIRILTNSSGLSKEDRKQISNLYDANLAYADHQVGEVLRLLKEQGSYDDTIVIVTADHGEALWEHGYQGHNKQVYEESARVPLIMKFPANIRNLQQTIHFPVQHADLFPSILSLLGLRARGYRFDGLSFAPWLTGSVAPERSIIVHTTRKQAVAMVLDDYKYIREEDDRHELYNLIQDPFERKNRHATEPIRAGYMNQLLHQKLAAFAEAAEKVETAELDEAARENLKALGYVD